MNSNSSLAAAAANSTAAAAGAEPAAPAPAKKDSLDDTISQVFDEIHMSPGAGEKLAHEEGNEQGFIGKHLKKLKEKEEMQKRKVEE